MPLSIMETNTDLNKEISFDSFKSQVLKDYELIVISRDSIRNGLFVNGYESTSMPSLRSFGFSINANL